MMLYWILYGIPSSSKNRTILFCFVFPALSAVGLYRELSPQKQFFFLSQKRYPMFSHFLFLSQSCIIQTKIAPHREWLVDIKNFFSSALFPAFLQWPGVKDHGISTMAVPLIKLSILPLPFYIYIEYSHLNFFIFLP